MIAYFDASALVKLLVDEAGSEDTATLWDGADLLVSSRLAHPEVCAALAAARRAARIQPVHEAESRAWWRDLSSSLHLVELSDEVSSLAGELTEAHPLGGADAIHLASALALGLSPAELVLATWDRRLAAGARAEGLGVFPAT